MPRIFRNLANKDSHAVRSQVRYNDSPASASLGEWLTTLLILGPAGLAVWVFVIGLFAQMVEGTRVSAEPIGRSAQIPTIFVASLGLGLGLSMVVVGLVWGDLAALTFGLIVLFGFAWVTYRAVIRFRAATKA